jgi:putative salt-induced outer membrane protein YdiY
VVYAQPRFSNFNDVRILSENHLGVVLTEKLSLSINFALMYDSEPPDGIKNLDTNTKLGLTIKL